MGKTRQESLAGLLIKGTRFLVNINVPEAVGAFSLTYAGLILSKGSAALIYPVLALLYVYGMHVLNRFLLIFFYWQLKKIIISLI